MHRLTNLDKSQMGIKPKGPLFLLHEVGRTEDLLCAHSKACSRLYVWKSIIAFCLSEIIAFYFSPKMLRMHVEFVLVSHFELGVIFLKLGATF